MTERAASKLHVPPKELTVVGLYVGLPGTPQERLNIDEHGVREDEKHYGPTRIVNARSRKNYPKPAIGSVEPNWRMFSAITTEDLNVIQERYDTRYGKHVGTIRPEWIGPNIVFEGMDNFSKLPDGTLIDFSEGPELRVTSENTSCKTPGKLIANKLGLPVEEASLFVRDADGYRGVVGVVNREGIVEPGMQAKIIFPAPAIH